MEKEKEIWKRVDVDCVSKYYEISNMGNVRSISKTDLTKIKNLSKIDTGKGYERIAIKTKTALIHRLVAQSFLPNPNNKPHVNHIDGNKKNNNVSNLEWITNIENLNHARATGLNKTKLTKEEFQNIKNSYDKDNSLENMINMSKEFNISIDYLRNILRDGLITFSENKRLTEFSNEEIEYIYKNTIAGDDEFGIPQMAKKFNVTTTPIYNIINNKTYKDITKDLNRDEKNNKIKFNKKELSDNPHHRKLSKEDVIYIYENTTLGRTELNVTKMAEKFKVSKDVISSIINNKTYIDITKDLNRIPSNRKIRTNKESQRKLSDEDVKYIYENTVRNHTDFSPEKMAEKFNVTISSIYRIINNKTYKNITKDLTRNKEIVQKPLTGKLSLDDVKYIYENTNYNDENFNLTAMSIKYTVGAGIIYNIINKKTHSEITKDLIRKDEYNKK